MEAMLSIRSLLVDSIDGITADHNLEHLSTMLSLYGKTLDNFVCLCADNCSVNGRMARVHGIPLLGCGSLAVRSWIDNDDQLSGVIQKVSKVMKRQVH
jgi:hypothetical protein